MHKVKFLFRFSIGLVGAFILLNTGQLRAQEVESDEFQDYVKEYYYSKRTGKGDKSQKWMSRWVNHYMARTNANGQLPNPQYYQEIENVISSKYRSFDASRASDSNWYPAGPDTLVPGSNWYSSHGVARVNCIEFHPTDRNTFWVGVAQGGIWKTTNSGKSYTPLNNNLPIIRISDIEVDPNNPDVIYISVGDYAYMSAALKTDGRKRNTHYGLGIYKSTDGGMSWNKTGLHFSLLDGDNSLIKRIFVNPANSNELVAVGITGVWKSYDAGVNWVKKLTQVMWDLEMNPLNPKSLLATSGWVMNLNIGQAEIWKSLDFGETWMATNNTIPLQDSVQRIDLTISLADTNVAYAISCGRDRGLYAVYISGDGGLNWNRTLYKYPNVLEWSEGDGPGGQGTYDLCIISDVHDANKVFSGGVNMWGSADGGQTWDGVSYWLRFYGFTPHADQHFLSYNPLDKMYYVCNDGGIFRTDSIQIGSWDSTNSNGYKFPTKWEDVSSGMQITSFYRVGISAETEGVVVAGAQDNGTYYKGKNGKWLNITGGDGMDCIIADNDPESIISSSQFGNFYSSNDGGKNSSRLGRLGNNEEADWTTPVVKIPGNNAEFLVGYENVYKSSFWGGSSRLSTIPSSNGNPIVDISVAKGDLKNMAVVKRPNYLENEKSELWVTNNGGQNWLNKGSNLPDSLFITSVVLDDRNPDLLWATIGGFADSNKVFRSENGGSSWSNVSKNLPNLPVNILVQDQQSLHNPVYVGTDVGVYYTNDSLNEWVHYSKLLPNVIVSDLQVHPKDRQLYASTFGRGIWTVNLIDTVHIWAEDTIKKPEPKDTVIVGVKDVNQSEFNVFPNPSNGEVWINFENQTLGNYQFDLINIFGSVVFSKEELIAKGRGKLRFNFNVDSGQYFLRISGGEKPKVLRLILE